MATTGPEDKAPREQTANPRVIRTLPLLRTPAPPLRTHLSKNSVDLAWASSAMVRAAAALIGVGAGLRRMVQETGAVARNPGTARRERGAESDWDLRRQQPIRPTTRWMVRQAATAQSAACLKEFLVQRKR